MQQRIYVCSAVILVLWSAGLSAQQQPPSPVVTAAATGARVEEVIELVGSIQAERTSMVGSQESGLVEELDARRGDYVEQGQLICRLNSDTLQFQLEEARATLESLQQTLAELQAGTRSEIIDQLKAVVEERRQEKRKWEIEKDRIEQARQANAATETEVETTDAEYLAADSRLAAAKATLAEAVKGPRKEEIARARAQVVSQEAVVARLEDQLAKSSIRAPFAGFLIRDLVEVGQWVNTGGSIVEMIDVSSVLARVDIPEQSIAFIQVGDDSEVFVEALDQRVVGTVARVIPAADPNARTFPVEVRLPNEQGMIKPGMFCRAKFPAGPTIDAVVVPKGALTELGPMTAVYVVIDNQAQPMPVETGIPDGTNIAVFGPVAPGMPVVVRGNERLFPGAPVQVTEGPPSLDSSQMQGGPGGPGGQGGPGGPGGQGDPGNVGMPGGAPDQQPPAGEQQDQPTGDTAGGGQS